MLRFKKKHLILFSLSIAIIAIAVFFIFPIYSLELRSFYEDKVLFSQRVQPGDKFTLEYTHSVALTPVWEIFVIDQDYQIILVETDFLDHGAGLPYAAFDQEIFVIEEGRFKIKNMQRIMRNPIYYRVGANSNNCFYFKDNKINLSSLWGDRLLSIGIGKKNLFSFLKGRNFR